MKILKTKGSEVPIKAKRFGLSPSSVAYDRSSNYAWQRPLRERKYITFVEEEENAQ